MLAGFLHRFRYLKVGLSPLLGFVGTKMLISDFFQVPVAWSLGAVAGILGVTILASYLATRHASRLDTQQPTS